MGSFGKGLARICAVAAAPKAAEMAAQVRAALREASTIELRIDWLVTDAERTRFLAWLRNECLGKNHAGRMRRATFLVTCRRRRAGGLFAGSIEAQLYWLIQAREAGCQWCDIEVETLRELPDQSIREYAVPRHWTAPSKHRPMARSMSSRSPRRRTPSPTASGC
jgi:3-dehydroquinate dehydratase